MSQPPKRRRKNYVPIVTSTVPDKVRAEGDPPMIGYARVSMSDQNNQRQIDELVKAGVAAVDIFTDTGSGKSMDRPGWLACWRQLDEGDVLVVHSGDRLGRNLIEVMKVIEDLHKRGVTLKILTMDLDTRTPVGRMIFSVMASFAQFERELIHERTMHGLQKARERGVVGGRAKTYTNEQILEAMKKYGSHEKAGKAIGASKITMIRRTKEIEGKL
ncbi:MAG: recombinase family protein [Janthinobacterium lividum]